MIPKMNPEPYSCPYCPEWYYRPEGIEWHISTTHPEHIRPKEQHPVAGVRLDRIAERLSNTASAIKSLREQFDAIDARMAALDAKLEADKKTCGLECEITRLRIENAQMRAQVTRLTGKSA